ncbi:MAG: hypothetical protein HC798_01160 [Polaribacter sp.]|nr:hypothetical protein [Polaribacter sp.]
MSDANYRAILVILNDIEAHGLIQFNKEYCNEDFFKNFLEFEKSFSNSIRILAIKLNAFQENNSEMVAFVIYSELSYILSHLDVINKFLKIVVNPKMLKGGFDENTALHQMITKICNKMQYSEKLKKSIRGLFLLEFKNAISTQQYLIYKNDDLLIYPKDDTLKKHFSIRDLTDYSLQVVAILDAMIDWSNGGKKTHNISSDSITNDNTTNALYELVNDMKKQVEILDRRLNRLF